MTWRLSTLLIALLLSAPLACDDKNEAPNNKPIPGADAGRDVKDAPDATDTPDTKDDPDASPGDTKDEGDTKPDLDAGNPDDADTAPFEPDGASGDAGFTPFDTSRPDTSGPGVSGSCDDIEDLGELDFGVDIVSFVYNADNDGVRTSCRDFSAPTTPDKIFKFTVKERSVLALQGNSNLTFELRTDPCGDEASVLTCNPNGRIRGQNIRSNTPVYLIVEFDGTIDDSEMNFQMSVSSPFADCQPGQSECISASEVKICNTVGTYETQTCPTSCSSEACMGDSCANPIPVTNGSASLAGPLTAFGNKMSTHTCGTGPIGQANSGQEVVFIAENLQPNQTITVDTNADSVANTIIIQRDICGQNAACEYSGISGEESVTYQVTQAGNYYIIIDSNDPVTDSANYNVNIN
ncbi:hypothetical protein [Bradymonas sediminis]|uniref:Uncharacterized protein n=1 Tax=Bradymonas sediminis TaxID=1548548 RepID=A0A2Z4FM40_9DELT|nr:hypothetical protein [Bradymonas sediminis]AWV90031.1 hypothetical protein DN745_12045 [Bradymonas sediminis]TDP76011.1 hypothetical protein DFR33_103361 [Bradymonas sediminis]